MLELIKIKNYVRKYNYIERFLFFIEDKFLKPHFKSFLEFIFVFLDAEEFQYYGVLTFLTL